MRLPFMNKNKNTEEFCDTIAASMARHEKYCCWASKRGNISTFHVATSAKNRLLSSAELHALLSLLAGFKAI